MQMKSVLTLLSLAATTAMAGGTLSEDLRITSDALGYDVQYRVYAPEGVESAEDLPVLFLTDGPGYIRRGKAPRVLDRLIESEKIELVVAVFVDSRDPDNLKVNRRNREFFCNPDYLRFYKEELIPAIEQDYPIGKGRESRSVLGLSFGGLNAACFGLLGYETFSGVGMHSPANYPVKNLVPAYEHAPKLPLRMFLSTGSPNDNTAANRKFRNVLRDKGYDIKYVETDAGHHWGNWRSLIDDVLLYFYGEAARE